MAKYYVITAGEYSDYHVVQITMDRKLAEAYVKLHGDTDDSMYIEEYDDLMDQCDIQDTFDKAYVRHPYVRVVVNKSGEIINQGWLKEKLMDKNIGEFYWFEKAPNKARFNPLNFWDNFEMWVPVDKYNYDFDKIVKVVMDTRAKMMAEREGL